jgi:hypothetical protein
MKPSTLARQKVMPSNAPGKRASWQQFASSMESPGFALMSGRQGRTKGRHHEAFGIKGTVPLGMAADSVRWARQALVLAESGIIGGPALIRCEDHLVTLWLLSDAKLAELLHVHPQTVRYRIRQFEQAFVMP